MPLIHCVYASAATAVFEPSGLPLLLEKSRAANAACDVTGMLLYSAGSFFQVLEGDESAVDGVMQRVSHDVRHNRVTIVIRETIAKRSFADWTMGYVSANADDLAEIVGRNDFFNEGSCLANLDSGRAKKLLTAFAGGRWRARLGPSVVAAATVRA
jgi:hypothetical protein